MTQPAWMETIFDGTPVLSGGGPVDPAVFDGSDAALRQRTANFAAKRYADMMFVSGLERATADRHLRLRVAQLPSGLRDYAKQGVLYLNDGVWDQQRLLPVGWVDYALTPAHGGTSYAACFRTNSGQAFPSLPADTAWASGASDQTIFIPRHRRLTVAGSNETGHAMDMAALNRLIATAIDSYS